MNPYSELPEKAFWKLAVSNRNLFDIQDLWDPKFKICPQNKITTYGSCFAQHIGQALQQRGFNWLITEIAPNNYNQKQIELENYNVFSARTGNIYTTSLLNQWLSWAINPELQSTEFWSNDDNYIDPFRPRINFITKNSKSSIINSRTDTLLALKKSILQADYFIFTLGLTESWVNTKHNYEYPMCPGTVAGKFDTKQHKFIKQTYSNVMNNLLDALGKISKLNPKIKFILTVSPVPLTATKSGNHVITATMASKSILRAVAEDLCTNYKNIDYFPSYEIINSPAFKSAFFELNMRQVNPYGVRFVMNSFFNCLQNKFGTYYTEVNKRINYNAVCDEEILDAFNK